TRKQEGWRRPILGEAFRGTIRRCRGRVQYFAGVTAASRTKSTRSGTAMAVGGGRMAETKTILVAGATGQQGGAVARSLVKRGHRVIGLTRSVSKLMGLAAAGIEGVQGDLTQRASLTALVRN